MKRIVASVGLVALGTSGLHTAVASSLIAPETKPWSVSATLRGFYDDNINTLNSALSPAPYHRSTFGFEVSPSFDMALLTGQTSLKFGYVYSFKEYQNRALNSTENYDMTHLFNIALDHQFNDQYDLKAQDSIAVGQEPELL